MKIKIITVGKLSLKPVGELVREYSKRLAHYSPMEMVTVSSVEKGLEKLQATDFIVLLDAAGRSFSSEDLARWVEEKQVRSTKQIVFVVGPAEGFSREAKEKANLLLSLSKMTLQHELALVVLLEQLYRAFTILKGEPYHK